MSVIAQATSTATAADWVNAIASVFAGLGTIVALVFSTVALLRERRRDREEAEKARQAAERAQAAQVLAWTSAVGANMAAGHRYTDFGLKNASDLPIYNPLVAIADKGMPGIAEHQGHKPMAVIPPRYEYESPRLPLLEGLGPPGDAHTQADLHRCCRAPLAPRGRHAPTMAQGARDIVTATL